MKKHPLLVPPTNGEKYREIPNEKVGCFCPECTKGSIDILRKMNGKFENFKKVSKGIWKCEKDG